MINGTSILSRLRRSEFLRNAMTLMTGSVIGQLILVVTAPILTRLYGPEEFGLLAIYVSVLSILSVVVTGQFELAVMLPDRDEDAVALVGAGVVFGLVIAVIFAGLLVPFSDKIAVQLGAPDLEPYLWFIPFTLVVLSVLQTLRVWAQRRKAFTRVAQSGVLESGVTSLLQIGLATLVASGGQIIGNFAGKIVTGAFLVRQCLRTDWQTFRMVSVAGILRNAREYLRFPRFSLPSNLLIAIVTQLPAIMTGRYFGAGAVGFYSLAQRILSLPSAVIAGAVARVLHQRIVEISKNNPDRLRPFVVQMFFLLLAIVSPMVILIWIYGEPLFAFAFGEQWREAGQFAVYLSFPVAIRFAVHPLTVAYTLGEGVKIEAVWSVAHLATMLGTLIAFRSQPLDIFLQALAVQTVIMYLASFVLIIRIVSGLARPRTHA